MTVRRAYSCLSSENIKEAGGGKSLRVYYVTHSCSGMTVKTFMTPNLYKHDMQKRTGNRMLTFMVIYSI